jgi:hypothetical protein
LGFEVVKKDFLQQAILIFNYFNLLVTNSIGKGRLSFPVMKQIITIEADLNSLIDNKRAIQQLRDHLDKQTPV